MQEREKIAGFGWDGLCLMRVCMWLWVESVEIFLNMRLVLMGYDENNGKKSVD
jgi:hypothetical protein